MAYRFFFYPLLGPGGARENARQGRAPGEFYRGTCLLGQRLSSAWPLFFVLLSINFLFFAQDFSRKDAKESRHRIYLELRNSGKGHSRFPLFPEFLSSRFKFLDFLCSWSFASLRDAFFFLVAALPR
jgi:hypothetical protein